MADLAPAGAAHTASLANGVGREVVVQHEVLAALALERVDHLLVLPGAERGDAQRLRLAAGEQRRAMRARQHADLGDDRAHRLGVAAIDAQPGVEDGVADDVGLDLLEQRLGRLGVQALADQRLGHLLLGGADRVVAQALVHFLVGLGERRGGQLLDARQQRGLLRPSAPAAPTAPWRRARPAR